MSETEIRRFEALAIPSDALEKGGLEVLRAAIVDNDLHVTLRRTFDEPKHWGGLLSEVVLRIARAYASDGRMREGEVVGIIRSAFAGDGKPAAKAVRSKPKKKARAKKAVRRRKKS